MHVFRDRTTDLFCQSQGQAIETMTNMYTVHIKTHIDKRASSISKSLLPSNFETMKAKLKEKKTTNKPTLFIPWKS